MLSAVPFSSYSVQPFPSGPQTIPVPCSAQDRPTAQCYPSPTFVRYLLSVGIRIHSFGPMDYWVQPLLCSNRPSLPQPIVCSAAVQKLWIHLAFKPPEPTVSFFDVIFIIVTNDALVRCSPHLWQHPAPTEFAVDSLRRKSAAVLHRRDAAQTPCSPTLRPRPCPPHGQCEHWLTEDSRSLLSHVRLLSAPAAVLRRAVRV